MPAMVMVARLRVEDVKQVMQLASWVQTMTFHTLDALHQFRSFYLPKKKVFQDLAFVLSAVSTSYKIQKSKQGFMVTIEVS